MFNLIIYGSEETWQKTPMEVTRDRVINANEYTVKEIAANFSELSQSNIEKLKSYPCIFACEGMKGFFRIGYINNIKLRSKSAIIDFEFDKIFPALPVEKLVYNKLAFDISVDFEFSRSHWALKDVELFSELTRLGFITQEQVNASRLSRNIQKAEQSDENSSFQNSVFIVHGHDDHAKVEAARFVESLGLQATILHEQANNGQTIIEKFEGHASQAAFAIILLTPDDVGYAKDSPSNAKYRARQNVIFELGYFCSALTRKRICVLLKEGVEMLNDFAGVVYTPMDQHGAWKFSLAKEMKAAGLNIDLNMVQ